MTKKEPCIPRNIYVARSFFLYMFSEARQKPVTTPAEAPLVHSNDRKRRRKKNDRTGGRGKRMRQQGEGRREGENTGKREEERMREEKRKWNFALYAF